MEIAIHMGAHHPDSDNLLKSIRENTDVLQDNGIAAPNRPKYRQLLMDSRFAKRDGANTDDLRAQILQKTVHDTENTRRLLLSDSFLLSGSRVAFSAGHLYKYASDVAASFGDIFKNDDLEFFIGISNFAYLIPFAFESSKAHKFSSYIQRINLSDYMWTKLILSIRAAAPNAKINIWCYEDAPLVWPELLRSFSSLSEKIRLRGRFSLLGNIISDQGGRALITYLKDNPANTREHETRLIAAFMTKFADQKAMEQTFRYHEWTQETVDYMTQAYDRDVARVSQIDGVNFIIPTI